MRVLGIPRAGVLTGANASRETNIHRIVPMGRIYRDDALLNSAPTLIDLACRSFAGITDLTQLMRGGPKMNKERAQLNVEAKSVVSSLLGLQALLRSQVHDQDILQLITLQLGALEATVRELEQRQDALNLYDSFEVLFNGPPDMSEEKENGLEGN